MGVDGISYPGFPHGHFTSPTPSMSQRGTFNKTHLSPSTFFYSPRLCRIAVFLIQTNVSLFELARVPRRGFIGNTYLLYPLPSIHKDDPVYH